ncbi:MAG: hypothetical protein K0R57_4335 [Paenibacillaceae bacterium]|jgi:hypothetical protein|nr:hypothetical protein [Paenibacillaceae bacterium]
MASISSLQIRQFPAKLGIDADLGQYSMRQPRASLSIRTEPNRMTIRSYEGELRIDQSKALDAYGLGGALQNMNRIYSGAHQAAQQGIARIVEYGNQLARIHVKTNPIADHARNLTFSFDEFNYVGEAGYDNVDITYTPRKPDIEITGGQVNIEAQINPPEVEYKVGKLDIYMMQYPKIEYTPPQIDLLV